MDVAFGNNLIYLTGFNGANSHFTYNISVIHSEEMFCFFGCQLAITKLKMEFQMHSSQLNSAKKVTIFLQTFAILKRMQFLQYNTIPECAELEHINKKQSYNSVLFILELRFFSSFSVCVSNKMTYFNIELSPF